MWSPMRPINDPEATKVPLTVVYTYMEFSNGKEKTEHSLYYYR